MTLESFTKDRFGLFIHFGTYAANAQSEWLKSHARLTNEQYQVYLDHFDPEPGCVREWARAAKEAGMKYAVLTTKHHEGFCLFETETTDYSAPKTIGRDLVREYVEAFRAEGIKIGFYFSVIDWRHFDFPHYGDLQHPQRDDKKAKAEESQRDFRRYLSDMHCQIRELLTNYGKIDIMWYDFSYNNASTDAKISSMKGETWEASKIVDMMHELQPGMIYNNRLGSNGGLLEAEPAYYAGDFTSPEQIIPPDGMKNVLGQPVPWEAAITINESWCYNNRQTGYKSVKTLIHALVDSVSKNGNLLLNVGPDAKGHFPEQALERLKAIGKWLSQNGESIYDCQGLPLAKPEWGRYSYRPATTEPAKLYAHVYERGIGPLPLVGLEGKIKSARLLSDGSVLSLARPWNVTKFPNDAFVDLPWSSEPPDELDTVIEMELKEDLS